MTEFENHMKNNPLMEGVTNSLKTSAKFLEETIAYPDRRARQGAALIDGVVIGGIKAIPDNIVNHPRETLATAVGGLAVGGALGAAAAIESPLIAAGVAIGATALTCKYVYDLGTKLSSDRQLTNALDSIWKSGTSAAFKGSLPIIEQRLGKETFDLALLGTTGGYAFKGGAALMKGALRPPAQLAFSEAAAGNAIKPPPVETAPKADNSFAMEAYRDRNGSIKYDRKAPEESNNLIEQPLMKRLDHLEQLIKNGKSGEAYAFVNANLEWYANRNCKYDSLHYNISKQFLYVGTNLWSVVHEGANKMTNKGLKIIEQMRTEFGEQNTDWPLKGVSAENVKCADRIKALTDKDRVTEIEKLVDVGFYSDASRVSNWGWIIHRDARNASLEKKYDMVLLETAKLSLNTPDASVPRCREQLAELKKAVGLK